MKHVLTLFEMYDIYETEEMPSYVSLEYKIKDATLTFEEIFPGDKLKLVHKNSHTQSVLDYMWQGRGWLVTSRKAVFGITEVSSPDAFSLIKTLAAGMYSKLIDHIKYDSPRKFQLPNGVWITFATLKLGERRNDGTQVWEPVALFDIDDYHDVIDVLKGGKAKTGETEQRHRKASVPSFEKAVGGGFWERIKMIRKLPDGTVDYGSSNLSSAEHKKFMRLRKEGVLKFDESGKLISVDRTFECFVPMFSDYLSFGS